MAHLAQNPGIHIGALGTPAMFALKGATPTTALDPTYGFKALEPTLWETVDGKELFTKNRPSATVIKANYSAIGVMTVGNDL